MPKARSTGKAEIRKNKGTEGRTKGQPIEERERLDTRGLLNEPEGRGVPCSQRRAEGTLNRKNRNKKEARARRRKGGNAWAHKRETNATRERERKKLKEEKIKTLTTGERMIGQRYSTG